MQTQTIGDIIAWLKDPEGEGVELPDDTPVVFNTRNKDELLILSTYEVDGVVQVDIGSD